MEAATLNCPMCGAPAGTESTVCEHCGARLAKVACPSCFGMIFDGAKFCSHCGARVERTDVGSDTPRKCPRCKIDMGAAVIGTTKLLECSKCEGLWVDADSLQQLCADREKQSAILGVPAPIQQPESADIETIRYVPCPVCATLMNRINFARCSHIIVDVCAKHGTWFDKDELRKMVEFIRGGGMEKSRERQITELEQKRSLLRTEQMMPGASLPDISTQSSHYDGFDLAIDAVSTALNLWLK